LSRIAAFSFYRHRCYDSIFGTGPEKRDNEADLIPITHPGFSKVIQLDLDILYGTLGILRVTIESVYPDYLRLFGLVSGSLAFFLPLAKLQK